jgi:peptidyl-dipeptidase Dcp
VGGVARGRQELRQALQDRRADAGRPPRQDAGDPEVQPGLRDNRIPERPPWIDQAWHTLRPDQVPTDVPALEAATFKKYGADFDGGAAPLPEHVLLARLLQSDGYSAGYYSYIWADVLVADSIEWFKQHGGLTRQNGDHFRATVLSHGGSVEAMTLFREFTGHGPEVGPLLQRKRGLDEPGN